MGARRSGLDLSPNGGGGGGVYVKYWPSGGGGGGIYPDMGVNPRGYGNCVINYQF